MSLKRYHGDHQNMPETHLLVNFATLLDRTMNFQHDPDADTPNQISQYLAADLVCLLSALVRMPMVQKFSLSDQRWRLPCSVGDIMHTYCDKQDTGFSLFMLKKAGQEKLMTVPREWCHDGGMLLAPGCSGHWYRGFMVLVQAALMLDLKKLQSFTIDCGAESGISYEIFQMSPTELAYTCNTFQYLITIRLKIQSPLRTNSGIRHDHLSSIASILKGAQNLAYLELGFNVPKIIGWVETLFSTQLWLGLKILSLLNLRLEEHGAVDLLQRHSRSLKALMLHNVTLLEKDNSSGSETFYMGPWYNAFESLSALQLDEFRIEGNDLPCRYRDWRSEDSATIAQFFADGGDYLF